MSLCKTGEVVRGYLKISLTAAQLERTGFVSKLSLLLNLPTTNIQHRHPPSSQHALMTVMATLAPPSPPRSPTRMPRKWARKCERYCCLGATYFPLVFVYSITSWAVWVEATIGFLATKSIWIGLLALLSLRTPADSAR
jgi:hypothetical protein